MERLAQGQRPAAAVAVVAQFGVHAVPASEQVLVAVGQGVFVALAVAVVRQRELGAGAQQVAVLEFEAKVGRATAAAAGDPGIERPGIPGFHHQVDAAVGETHRPNLRLAQVVLGTQQAFGFVQKPAGIGHAGLDQQQSAHHRFAGPPVQGVGGAEDAGVLFGERGVEDVVADDADLADHRAGGFECGVVGKRRGGCRGDGLGQAQQEGEKQALRREAASSPVRSGVRDCASHVRHRRRVAG